MSSRRTSAASTSSHRSHSGGAPTSSPHQRVGSGRRPEKFASSTSNLGDLAESIPDESEEDGAKGRASPANTFDETSLAYAQSSPSGGTPTLTAQPSFASLASQSTSTLSAVTSTRRQGPRSSSRSSASTPSIRTLTNSTTPVPVSRNQTTLDLSRPSSSAGAHPLKSTHQNNGHHQLQHQPSLGPRIRIRNTPHLPNQNASRASAAIMHWSRAPVHGTLPTRNMRAHSATLVDHTVWIFGGCDDAGCWGDVWCFDIETFQWSHPQMVGENPPHCRAHTATLVDRKLIVFGGGEGSVYYNQLYILDTITYRWTHPVIGEPLPPPRRAHTTVFWQNRLYIFGGGNGQRALNDVWVLDLSVPLDQLQWTELETVGNRPGARGYHTANLVGEMMVVIGGSDGKECFSDVWVLNLETLVWREVHTGKQFRRLSHSSTQVGSYLFLIGGHDGGKYSHEILMFNLVSLTYEDRQVTGRTLPSRGYHAAILADSRIFLFGGFDGHSVFDDVWILDLAAAAYLPQVTSFSLMID
ncbi:hypothetical protein BOTBODRAFT_156457 [Botryobasidium botryosum FD-172 SS1]|uniref:Galactose oxidase n=1 Tax=Botryobasidium botryosum (strain FD-172 SS1) TaxID=930990 RepID=A0A067MMT5_BOTB1|nr:hypothetical protein BOTBODRAFT_156457 [Botryobasidium botryosum FD-172 SS1]